MYQQLPLEARDNSPDKQQTNQKFWDEKAGQGDTRGVRPLESFYILQKI